MACNSVRGERETWAVRFFAKPLAYTFRNGTLTLSSGTALVHFKEQAPTPSATSDVAWNPRLADPARTFNETADSLPACTLAQLTTWGASDGGGSMGTFYEGVYVRNDGPDCSLSKSDISATLGHTLKTAPLTVTAKGSAVMPAGSSERLQLAHGRGCEPVGKDVPEPVRLTAQAAHRDLNVTFPWGGGCTDLLFSTWSLTAAKEFQTAGNKNALPHLSISLDVPGSGTFSGGVLHYVVRISNTGKQTYAPATCPRFVQVLRGDKTITPQPGTLNCRNHPLRRGATVAFDMTFVAPGGTSHGLGWYLTKGAGDSAFVFDR